jgi:hypothetical protein
MVVGVRNYMNMTIYPSSFISEILQDAISLRSKLFNLKVNHEKSICLDGFNSLVGNDNLCR